MMLIHQVIQDMPQEFSLIKMEMQIIQVIKEIVKMKRTKLKKNQNSQHAMDPTEPRVLIALQESHLQCAQEIKNQRSKKE
jgi:hypothetical protein